MDRIEQSPHDLCLVVSQQVSAIPVTIIRQKTLSLGSGQVSFNILSESHMIQLEFPGIIVQELLFCSKQLPISPGHVHYFKDLQTHHYNDKSLEYSIQIQFGTDVLWRKAEANETQLSADFTEVFGHIPLTEIVWQVRSGFLQWRTRHIYPMSDDIIHVVSESSIRLPHAVA